MTEPYRRVESTVTVLFVLDCHCCSLGLSIVLVSATNGSSASYLQQTVVLAREPWRRRPGTGTSLRREKAVGAAYRYLCVPHCRPLSLPWFQPATLDQTPTQLSPSTSPEPPFARPYNAQRLSCSCAACWSPRRIAIAIPRAAVCLARPGRRPQRSDWPRCGRLAASASNTPLSTLQLPSVRWRDHRSILPAD